MKVEKIPKTPKRAKGIEHAVNLLRAIGIECTETHLGRILRDKPTAQDDHGRIYMDEVLAAINEAPPPTDEELEEKEILERRKLREQYLRAKQVREREGGLLFHRDDLQREGIRIGTAIAAMLDDLVAEVPHWAGLPQAEASQKAKARAAEIRAEFQNESEKLWGKT